MLMGVSLMVQSVDYTRDGLYSKLALFFWDFRYKTYNGYMAYDIEEKQEDEKIEISLSWPSSQSRPFIPVVDIRRTNCAPEVAGLW